MKLFEVILTQKKKKGDTTPIKTRPVLVVAENVPSAKVKVHAHWSKQEYTSSKPNMIADFNPK